MVDKKQPPGEVKDVSISNQGSSKEAKDILWGMYQENCVQGRHHETQRSTVSSIFVTISAGALGVITYDKEINWDDIPLAAFLIVVGLFGAVFCWKHYERWLLHMERAAAYRNKLESLFSVTMIKGLKTEADLAHGEAFPAKSSFWQLHRERLHRLWIGLHGLIVFLGAMLLVLSLFEPPKENKDDSSKTPNKQPQERPATRQGLGEGGV